MYSGLVILHDCDDGRSDLMIRMVSAQSGHIHTCVHTCMCVYVYTCVVYV